MNLMLFVSSLSSRFRIPSQKKYILSQERLLAAARRTGDDLKEGPYYDEAERVWNCNGKRHNRENIEFLQKRFGAMMESL